MNEIQIGFLIKAATFVSQGNSNDSKNVIKSYYLMRCKEIARGYGLPQKHFSVKSRCPKCCIEWCDDTETRMKPIKMSKNMRRRIRLRQNNPKNCLNREHLRENKLEKICGFCKHIASSFVLKPPKKSFVKSLQENDKAEVIEKIIKKKAQNIPKSASSVYCQSKEAFSLVNQNNTLPNKAVKENPIIVNCKKRKDKFAGLCQRAVLAANKLKLGKDKQNKINLFLKPS